MANLVNKVKRSDHALLKKYKLIFNKTKINKRYFFGYFLCLLAGFHDQ